MATSQVETVNTGADKAKLAVAALLVVGGFVAYFVLSGQNEYVRWGSLAAGIVLGAVLFLFSASGKALWAFGAESERELRKVVWPTRKETLQTSLFVFVFVFIMSLFLWLVDKGIGWLLYDVILGWK